MTCPAKEEKEFDAVEFTISTELMSDDAMDEFFEAVCKFADEHGLTDPIVAARKFRWEDE